MSSALSEVKEVETFATVVALGQWPILCGSASEYSSRNGRFSTKFVCDGYHVYPWLAGVEYSSGKTHFPNAQPPHKCFFSSNIRLSNPKLHWPHKSRPPDIVPLFPLWMRTSAKGILGLVSNPSANTSMRRRSSQPSGPPTLKGASKLLPNPAPSKKRLPKS